MQRVPIGQRYFFADRSTKSPTAVPTRAQAKTIAPKPPVKAPNAAPAVTPIARPSRGRLMAFRLDAGSSSDHRFRVTNRSPSSPSSGSNAVFRSISQGKSGQSPQCSKSLSSQHFLISQSPAQFPSSSSRHPAQQHSSRFTQASQFSPHLELCII